MNIDDVVNAVDFVSSDPYGDCDAFICKTTGAIICRSRDFDELHDFMTGYEIPADIDDEDKYLLIPNKQELDLGAPLAISFAVSRRPQFESNVRSFFRKRGAYSFFKDWLNRQDLLDEWYQFEADETIKAVARWLNAYGFSAGSDGVINNPLPRQSD